MVTHNFLPTRQPVRQLARAAGLLIHDAFDGSGALDAHTPAPVNRVGANWGEDAASLTLSGGVLDVDGAFSYAAASLGGGLANARTVSARITLNNLSGNNFMYMLYMRGADPNGLRGDVAFEARFRFHADDARIYEYPSETLRATASYTWAADTYTLAVRDDGVRLDVYINGVPVVGYSAAVGYGNAYVGLAAQIGSGLDSYDVDWLKVQ